NDNVLLTSRLISSVWLPLMNRRHRVPVIVGVSSLLSSEVQMGSLAMLPDHAALGVQTANLVFDLADQDWVVGNRGIQLPVSVKTVVDIDQVRQYFGLQENAVDKIDQVIE